jgi:anhydro-N-acetylmuramic acid kinase
MIYNVIGVMSGTSLDGIDIVNVVFTYKFKWTFVINHCTTVPYSDFWVKRLTNVNNLKVNKLVELDNSYTKLLSSHIIKFIEYNKIKDIDAVCSHGHTIFHQPDNGFTYQIGNLPILSKLIKNKVVVDFRKQDIELGGQGAPLVPVGDKILFPEFSGCLNLGGFANLSLVFSEESIAFDICPLNTILNPLAHKIGLEYDSGGINAEKGALIPLMLNELNSIAFYKKESPKSLGVEWNEKFIWPIINKFNSYPIADLLNTYTNHAAYQIGSNFKEDQKVLVSGGGSFNSYLMNKIKSNSKAKFSIPDHDLIRFKEAIIFGFLGVLRLRNEINCFSSVTGAKKNHSSGFIFSK